MRIFQRQTRRRQPRILRQRKGGIDWDRFSNSDYRGFILLPIAATALARYAGRGNLGPNPEKILAKDAFEAVFEWLCENLPNVDFGTGDTRSGDAAELAFDFVRQLFDRDAAEAALVWNMQKIQNSDCGPMR